MPSVEMRRTTRVFGVVKGADGARALRSGKRLWPDSGEGKESRSGSYGEEWYDTLANGDSGDACKKDGWVPSINSMEGVAFTGIDDHGGEVPETMNSPEVPDGQGAVDRRWGLVYTRKKTIKRYARQFARRQKRRKNNSGDNRLDFTGHDVAMDGFALGPVLAVMHDSSSMGCFACILNLVLRYMKKARVKLSELSAFLSTEPIGPVYSSHGIRFMQDLPSTPTSGICKIYQASQLTPMFTVDFSAIPGCFLCMHLSMFLQSLRLPIPLVKYLMQTFRMYDDEKPSSRLPSDRRIIFGAGHLVNRAVLHPSVRDSELAVCAAQYSDGFNLGIYQKKRSSIPRKSRTPCLVHNVLPPADKSIPVPGVFEVLDKTIPVLGVREVSDKTIPVPVVREVSDYGDSNVDTFLRPDSYIRLNCDEVARALSKRIANYDMDSDDEEWLKKFNIGLFGEDGRAEYITVDRFESMVDEFEKALFRSPDGKFDENAAINHCLVLGERKVVEKVCEYWKKKRALKRSALLRVFQLQQKSASHVSKSGLRKRRSSKRQLSQSGRGKQPSDLLAIAAEQNALQEAEKAKAYLKNCNEEAVARRQRAQSLAESADLAVYKATMAVQVAAAAELVGSTSISCDELLDECDKEDS